MGLDTYIPTPRDVVAGGKTLQITPLRVRQIPAFAAAVAPAAGLLMSGDVLKALAVHGDSMLQAVAVATGEPADWLGDLLPDDFIGLASVVVEVNADFFVQRLAPAIEAATAQLQRTLTPTAGATPSPS